MKCRKERLNVGKKNVENVEMQEGNVECNCKTTASVTIDNNLFCMPFWFVMFDDRVPTVLKSS